MTQPAHCNTLPVPVSHIWNQLICQQIICLFLSCLMGQQGIELMGQSSQTTKEQANDLLICQQIICLFLSCLMLFLSCLMEQSSIPCSIKQLTTIKQLQHTATRYNTLQHIGNRALFPVQSNNQRSSNSYNTLQHATTHCNTLQHTWIRTLFLVQLSNNERTSR